MFWSAYSSVYDRLWDQPLHHHTIEEAIGHLEPGLRVQEVGARTGLATQRLIGAGFTVDASEPNAAMRRRFAAALPGVPVLAGSVTDLPTPADEAPARNVLAINVLHLVDDPSAVIDDLRRRAGPEGRVVIVVPVLGLTLGALTRAMRERGATRRQQARFLALQTLTAPLQAGARVQARPIDIDGHPGLVHLESISGVHHLAVFTGAQRHDGFPIASVDASRDARDQNVRIGDPAI